MGIYFIRKNDRFIEVAKKVFLSTIKKAGYLECPYPRTPQMRNKVTETLLP